MCCNPARTKIFINLCVIICQECCAVYAESITIKAGYKWYYWIFWLENESLLPGGIDGGIR